MQKHQFFDARRYFKLLLFAFDRLQHSQFNLSDSIACSLGLDRCRDIGFGRFFLLFAFRWFSLKMCASIFHLFRQWSHRIQAKIAPSNRIKKLGEKNKIKIKTTHNKQNSRNGFWRIQRTNGRETKINVIFLFRGDLFASVLLSNDGKNGAWMSVTALVLHY